MHWLQEALALTPEKPAHLMESTGTLMTYRMNTMFFEDMSGLVSDKMVVVFFFFFFLHRVNVSG